LQLGDDNPVKGKTERGSGHSIESGVEGTVIQESDDSKERGREKENQKMDDNGHAFVSIAQKSVFIALKNTLHDRPILVPCSLENSGGSNHIGERKNENNSGQKGVFILLGEMNTLAEDESPPKIGNKGREKRGL
jgi:hypothetical protein